MVTKISRRRIEQVDNTEKLPDSVLTTILLLLPSESLRYTLKYVCKRWFNIITHEILSDVASIIIQRPHGERDHRVYETRLLDICEENNKLIATERDLAIPCKGRISSSCNEFLLITESDKHGALYIYNLISKVGITLSWRGSGDCGGHYKCKCGLSLAFDKVKGLYKIVHVYLSDQSIQCEMFAFNPELQFLNRSKWEKIDIPSDVGSRKYYWDDPISVNGRYLHWDVCSAKYILSMDIVEEKIFKIPLPGCLKSSYSLLEMGGSLCLFLQNHNYKTMHFIWSLCHIERKEWHSLNRVNFESSGLSRPPAPIAMLRRGNYIICKRRGLNSALFGYKLDTGSMIYLDIPVNNDERCLALSTDLGVTMAGNCKGPGCVLK